MDIDKIRTHLYTNPTAVWDVFAIHGVIIIGERCG